MTRYVFFDIYTQKNLFFVIFNIELLCIFPSILFKPFKPTGNFTYHND